VEPDELEISLPYSESLAKVGAKCLRVVLIDGKGKNLFSYDFPSNDMKD